MLVPQIAGGFLPAWPVAWKLAVHAPAVVAVYPDMVSKSSLSWQMSSEALSIVNEQVPALEPVPDEHEEPATNQVFQHQAKCGEKM